MLYVAFAIGVLVGCILAGIIFFIRHPVLGELKIDETDPTNVKWRFVITKEIDFSKCNRIVLEVNDNADLSQD